MKNQSTSLYTIDKNVICLQCGHKGAVQSFGCFYEKIDSYDNIPKILKDKVGQPFMSYTMGFGGTIPYECTNCGNEGLIDFGGLEGYKQAFISIEKTEKIIMDTFTIIDEVVAIYQKNNTIYVYFQSEHYEDGIMEEIIERGLSLDDITNNIYETHYIPSAMGSLEDQLGNSLKCLYKR